MVQYIERHNCRICYLSGAVVIDKAGVQPKAQPKRTVTDFGL